MIKKIKKEELIEALWEKKSEISKMYYSCYKQQQGFQFWIYLDLESLELKESSMLTMSTFPNPANWYPNDNTVIVDVIRCDAIDHLDDDATNYYNENPDEYLDDIFDDKCKRILDALKEEGIEVIEKEEWDSRRITKFFKHIIVDIVDQTNKKVEGTINAKDIYDISWSEHEPGFTDTLYNSVIKELSINEDQVSDFHWEGNSMNNSIEITIEL